MRTSILSLLNFAPVVVLGLASCSDDRSVQSDPPVDNGAIRFSAAAPRPTSSRADVTTNSLTQFTVDAFTQGSGNAFMDNVTVTKTGTNTWEYSPLKYWPSTPLDFYAFYPDWVPASSGPLEPVTYDNIYGNSDIVYAVALGRTQSSVQTEATVRFNFRHALAKVSVNLSSSDTKLIVKVSAVNMVGLYTKGDFTYPKASTDAGSTDASAISSWGNLSQEYTYLMMLSQGTDDVLTLTPEPTSANVTGLGQYMIPQTLNWVNQGDYTTDDFLQVDFKIYDAASGEQVWPNANTSTDNIVTESATQEGRMKFPLSTADITAWQPGYHYIYNVVLNANEDMGAITFGDPTVDTYVDVTATVQ